jgi:hypothetical protein
MDTSDTEATEIHWSFALEDVIASIAERCLCYHWLHSKSEKYFSKKHDQFTLPVIILNTLAGTGSVSSTLLFESKSVTVILGFLTIIIGIINMVNNHYSFAKKSENHRMSSINYFKIHEFIKIELSLPRNERMEPNTLLKSLREQTQRLHEISNQIPDNIIKDFQDRFKDTTPEVSKPEIMDILEPITINRSNNRAKSFLDFKSRKIMEIHPLNSSETKKGEFKINISPKIVPLNLSPKLEKDLVEIYNNTEILEK